DYRYFPEPDLTKFTFTDDFIETIRKTIPVLQKERIKKYTTEYQLSYYDASLLTEEKNFSDYFEKVIERFNSSEGAGGRPKPAANWMLGPVKSWLNDNNADIDQFPLQPKQIAAIIKLVEDGKLSFSVASGRLFNELIRDPNVDPATIAEHKNLLQESNADHIENLIDEVLNKFPEKVREYKKGKKGLIGLFVGEVMKLSKGKADPKITNDILSEKLNS
ncbi:MAG TPA: Asp-tRNA(Asn)/Glu-tRNA(Gln) amidotransferase GatCAB subunit B, partial [Chitinophagaceae bacterium]|nr:Asp-tRNA(Asn)/Glu-tRNA(Gln) amidotransferase GatCAB subunit B [Chitinophagaceae bacterium]